MVNRDNNQTSMRNVKIVRKNPYRDIKLETGYWLVENNLNTMFIRHSYEDKPAIIYNDGSKVWYKDSEIHRDIGVNYLPAIISSNGNKFWHDHGNKYWFIENQRYNSVEEVY